MHQVKWQELEVKMLLLLIIYSSLFDNFVFDFTHLHDNGIW